MRLPHCLLLTCPRLKDELVSIQCAIAYHTTPLMYAAKEQGEGWLTASERRRMIREEKATYTCTVRYQHTLFEVSVLAEGLTSR